MAQAARLNLRMQKELKLLLTDPPPGASFPSLSDDSSAPSLTSIDALFQGPEGTVYANGVFKINIQIPERYPFQPPIVTFATPIYHPNIDNGGRICLDILNLPPKGTWQPSLNISTVLTSIGLLLSEPNPDDGLMHEASREYKYNRQAFDQNARFMTEKYARAGESEIAGGSRGSQSHAGPSTAQTELERSDASKCVSEHLVSHTRILGSSWKLSLESVGSSSNRDSGVCKVPIQDYSNNYTENGQLKEANNAPAEFNVNPGKLQTTRNKLSLKVSVAPHSRNVESAKNLPNQCSSMSGTQTPSTDTPGSLPLVQVGSIVSMRDEDHIKRSSTSVSQDQQSLSCVKMGQTRDSGEKLRSVSQHAVSQLDATRPHKALSWSLSTTHNKKSLLNGAIAGKGSSSASTRLKGVGLIGPPVPPSGSLGCPQHYIEDEKENLAPTRSFLHRLTDQSAALPISSVVLDNGKYYNERTEREELIKAPKLSEFKPMDQPMGCINDMILHSENPSTPHFKFLGVTNDVGSDDEKKNNQDHDGKSINMFKQLTEGPQIPEAVIVLDSEDSEDENIPVRSKLSLGKRCLSRKRKSGF